MSNPHICHDQNKYLKCYFDGNYQLTFGKGNFKVLKVDSTFEYSDIDKTFTFYRKMLSSSAFDTLVIQQNPHSVIISNGIKTIEINDLSNVPQDLMDLGVVTFTVDGFVRGLALSVGEKFFKIEIWTYGKSWHWSFNMKQFHQRLTIQYNGYRGNRVESIIIQDDDQQYGLAISMTFKSLRKIKRLMAFYAPLEQRTSATSYSIIPIEKSYRYEYKSSGKLTRKNLIGKHNICNCE